MSRRPVDATLPLLGGPRSPAQSPKGALPRTAAKRRQFLQESEDDFGKLFIEQYVYRRDPFRSTSLPFPLPAPMVYGELESSIKERIEAHPIVRTSVRAMLEQHDLEDSGMMFTSQSKPGYPNGGDDPKTVLQIAVHAGNINPVQQWSAARRDITAVVDDLGFPDVEVEILDLDRFYKPSIFPILPGHPAVRLYKAVREELLACVHHHLGYQWSMLSLYNVGRNANVAKPKIVLMVKPLVEHDWNLLSSRLQGVVAKEQTVGPRLEIEIMPGQCGDVPQATMTAGSQSGQSFYTDLETHPRQGSSIGVRGLVGGGTLGGWFLMRSPRNTHHGFLTNSHVVKPPDETTTEIARMEFDAYGLAYNAKDSDPGRTWLHYLAVKDVNTTKEVALKNKERFDRSIKDVEEQEAEREVAGSSTAQKRSVAQTRIAYFKEERTKASERLSTLEKMPRLLGRTIVASGRRLDPELKTLDYAFVETSRVGNLALPKQSDFESKNQMPSDLGIDRAFGVLPKAPGFANIHPGHWYWKIGRTTGLTGGICNGVDAWIPAGVQSTQFDEQGRVIQIRRAGQRLELDEEGKLVYGVDGKPKHMKDKHDIYYSSEWVIVNGSINPLSFTEQNAFSYDGDSGSLVLDVDSNIAGLMWGSMQGWCAPQDKSGHYHRAGLVSDISDVKASLKTMLGWPANAQVDCLTLPPWRE